MSTYRYARTTATRVAKEAQEWDRQVATIRIQLAGYAQVIANGLTLTDKDSKRVARLELNLAALLNENPNEAI